MGRYPSRNDRNAGVSDIRMSVRTYDVMVIGAGPAGLAAASVAGAAGRRVILIDRMGPGGELMNLAALSGVAELGLGESGPDVIGALTDQVLGAGVALAIDEVTRLAPNEAGWLAETSEGPVTAKAVIVATGLTPGTTGLAEEHRFEGKGLSHCAHCDGPLYAGLPVAVAGSDAWAVAEAVELAAHAGEVTLVASGLNEALRTPVAGLPNVHVVEGTVSSLIGDDRLEAITVTGPDGVRPIAARGLFLQTGRVPARSFIEPKHEIAPGLMFAGDVMAVSGRTVAEAIAAGRRAGQNALDSI